MKCVLHIGTEKTGTTLLQKWLYANIKELQAQRVYLSNSLGGDNNIYFPSFFNDEINDFELSKNINSLKEKKLFFSDFIEILSSEIKLASINNDVFLITSEHLHSRITSSEQINSIRNFLDENFEEVFIVCYFREQLSMATSLYSTALKLNSSDSIEAFANDINPDNYYYNSLKIADNWSSVFGKENCLFRIYDRNLFLDNDIRKDFISLLPINLNIERFNFDIESANEGLTYLQALIFSSINKHFPLEMNHEGGDSKVNLLLKKSVMKINSLRQGNIVIRDRERDRVINDFQKINDDFLKKYIQSNAKFNYSLNEHIFDDKNNNKDILEMVRDISEILIPDILNCINHSNQSHLDSKSSNDLPLELKKKINSFLGE